MLGFGYPNRPCLRHDDIPVVLAIHTPLVREHGNTVKVEDDAIEPREILVGWKFYDPSGHAVTYRPRLSRQPALIFKLTHYRVISLATASER